MNIQESMHRILADKDNVATLFYSIFFERYPEVKPYFEGVKLPHQAELLRMALMVMEQHYSHNYPATDYYLKYLGTKHRALGIPFDEYPKFGQALVATLEKFHGPDWNAQVASQWQEAIDRTTRLLFEGYRTQYTV